MSSISKLLTEYNHLGRGNNERKRAILFELKSQPCAETSSFLMHVALCDEEWDVIRVEALGDLANNEYMKPSDDGAVANAISQLIEDVRVSSLVRQHAALAVDSFLKSEVLFNTVQKHILDPFEDLDVRLNLLASLQSAGSSERAISVLNAITNDRELGSTARGVLEEWGRTS